MLQIENQESFNYIKNQMEKIGGKVNQSFLDKLEYLKNYASGIGQRCEKKGTKCILYPDTHKKPYFDFTLYRGTESGEWEYWFNGGFCYHGPELPGFEPDPFKPISLHSSDEGYWSIHT